MTASAIPDFYALPTSVVAAKPRGLDSAEVSATYTTFMRAISKPHVTVDEPEPEVFADELRQRELEELLDDCRDMMSWLDIPYEGFGGEELLA